MTEKERFENRLNKSNIKFNTLNPVWDNEKEDALNVFEMIDLLNELYDEKERWKSMSVATSNENAILWNEVNILMEQGAEPSDAFKKYLESISTEHTKFWQRKLEKAKKDGVIE